MIYFRCQYLFVTQTKCFTNPGHTLISSKFTQCDLYLALYLVGFLFKHLWKATKYPMIYLSILYPFVYPRVRDPKITAKYLALKDMCVVCYAWTFGI